MIEAAGVRRVFHQTGTGAAVVAIERGSNFGMKIADLVTGTQLYALTALDLCNQERG